MRERRNHNAIQNNNETNNENMIYQNVQDTDKGMNVRKFKVLKYFLKYFLKQQEKKAGNQ